MPDFAFRFRIRFASSRIALKGQEGSLRVAGLPGALKIRSRPSNVPLEEADDFVFSASGFSDEAAAQQAAAEVVADLKRTLARLHIGADFGELAPKSMFFKAGLELLGQDGGPQVLNDEPGIMVFETGAARFASLGPAKITITQTGERFEKVVYQTRSRSRPLTRKEELAFELYAASFFQTEPRARFLLLFMALEALIQVDPRPQRARWLVDGFVHAVRGDLMLSDEERGSLEGGLVRLRDESIASAGRRFTQERLGDRLYMDRPATEFFKHCSRLRGKLVHGKLPGTGAADVATTAASLETFVAEILTYDLLDIEL